MRKTRGPQDCGRDGRGLQAPRVTWAIGWKIFGGARQAETKYRPFTRLEHRISRLGFAAEASEQSIGA
jgi:hypothetical protein